jgi:hypothetical protein
MNTTASKVRSRLENIQCELIDLIHSVPIYYKDYSSDGIVVVAPKYHWKELDNSQKSIQIKLIKNYKLVSELLSLFFMKSTKNLIRKYEQADKVIKKWIEFESSWHISGDKVKNEKKLRKDFNELFELIGILDVHNSNHLILIPDTNSLIQSCDPNKYKNAVSNEEYAFLLIPTVLHELDELKILHRNENVRNKAKKAITRIKGWRNQGSLISGITVNKTITVKTIASEPDMNNTLSWLDKDNSDDRIVAKVIEVQNEFPASRVVLVTGDINLQNKAEAALIEYSEI